MFCNSEKWLHFIACLRPQTRTMVRTLTSALRLQSGSPLRRLLCFAVTRLRWSTLCIIFTSHLFPVNFSTYPSHKFFGLRCSFIYQQKGTGIELYATAFVRAVWIFLKNLSWNVVSGYTATTNSSAPRNATRTYTCFIQLWKGAVQPASALCHAQ